MEQAQLSKIFEEWKTRYDEDPESFQNCEAFQKESPENYGEAAAIYFLWLIKDLEQ